MEHFYEHEMDVDNSRPDEDAARQIREGIHAANRLRELLPERRRSERRGAGMAEAELSDLSREAGRPLTEVEAEAYRRRKIEWDGVERRIAERRAL